MAQHGRAVSAVRIRAGGCGAAAWQHNAVTSTCIYLRTVCWLVLPALPPARAGLLHMLQQPVWTLPGSAAAAHRCAALSCSGHAVVLVRHWLPMCLLVTSWVRLLRRPMRGPAGCAELVVVPLLRCL